MDVKFLVDTGASTSFINEALVRRLGLVPRPHTTAVYVTYSDGRRHQSPGLADIKGVLQGTPVDLVATIAPLGAADIIIGVDWLDKQDVDISVRRR
eukprot:10612657-Prorocentrum_lima.AAC.1